MDRDEIRERFSPLLDGELNPEERAEVEAALAQDAELLRELDSLKRVDALYAALAPVPAPEGFEERVHAALRPSQLQFGKASVLRRRMWPMLAAAAMFLVVGGYVLLQTQGPASKFEMAATRAPAADRAYPKLDAAPPPSAARQETAGSSVQAQIPEEGKQEYLAGRMSENSLRQFKGEPQAADSAAPAEAEPPASPQAMAAQAPARANDFDDFDFSEGSAGQSSARRDGGEVRARAAAGAPASAPAAPPEPPTPAADEATEAGLIVNEVMSTESVGRPAEIQPSTPEAAKPKDAAGDKALAKGMLSESSAPATESIREPAKEAPSAFGSAYAPSPSPQPKPETSAMESRTIAKRIFEHVDKRWIEKGYKGEKLTSIVRGSKEWKALSTKALPLDDVLMLEGTVVLRVKDTWYELLPEKPSSQPAPSGR